MVKDDSGKFAATYFAEKGSWDETVRHAARVFFDEIKEIVIVRDPRDLMCSAMSFWRQTVEEVFTFLDAALPQIAASHDNADANTLFVLYEDLIGKPDETLAGI